MDPSVAANISATFYDLTGTAVSTVTRTVNPNLSTTVDQRAAGGGLDSFSSWQGAVVLSSTLPLAAIVNEYAGNASTLGKDFRADSYNGVPISVAATTVRLPQLLKNVNDPATNSTYNSLMSIQNTSSVANANVTVAYTNFDSTVYTHSGILIPPQTAAVFDLQTEGVLSGVSLFYGSGTVTSDQPVAILLRQDAAGSLASYPGFISADGVTTLYVPQVLKNVYDSGTNYTYGSGIIVMSADGTPANVTVTIYNYNGHVLSSAQTANPSATFDQRIDPALAGESLIYGSAVITANKPVFAIVASVVNYDATRGLRTTQTKAFASGSGTTKAFVPLILKNYYDSGTNVTWGTGVLGRLLGSSSATVTITYYFNGITRTSTANVSPSSPMFTFDQRSDPNLADQSSVYGSAVITSSQPFAVFVAQVGDNTTPGDAATVYAGINQ